MFGVFYQFCTAPMCAGVSSTVKQNNGAQLEINVSHSVLEHR